MCACRDDGATILMSTHALDTAERLCDTFLYVHEGRLIAQGTLHELQRDPSDTLLDVFDDVIARAARAEAMHV
ncbi:hypothetical protein [Caryophanon latum]|uniref:ABC transporter ATP-binding protein n=1 Tax=Caryophanon latum TaxID=33977 RepID=A0A1C0YU67_9BACL|nr:hypothetical protein [Caryophanon latum]OCS90710.1 hypothetical protein A6K76_01270 [Caryophanon latum]